MKQRGSQKEEDRKKKTPIAIFFQRLTQLTITFSYSKPKIKRQRRQDVADEPVRVEEVLSGVQGHDRGRLLDARGGGRREASDDAGKEESFSYFSLGFER